MWELSYHSSFMSDTSAVKESGVCLVSIQFACTVTEWRGKARQGAIPSTCVFFSLIQNISRCAVSGRPTYYFDAIVPCSMFPIFLLARRVFVCLTALDETPLIPPKDPQTACIGITALKLGQDNQTPVISAIAAIPVACSCRSVPERVQPFLYFCNHPVPKTSLKSVHLQFSSSFSPAFSLGRLPPCPDRSQSARRWGGTSSATRPRCARRKSGR